MGSFISSAINIELPNVHDLTYNSLNLMLRKQKTYLLRKRIDYRGTGFLNVN
jgi:hypothetical protein